MGAEDVTEPDDAPTGTDPHAVPPPAEDLEPLREALAALRAEVDVRLRRPARPPPRHPRGEVEALFERLRTALSGLGIHERRREVDEFGMDSLALERAGPALDLLADRWWRVETEGLDGARPGAPALLVSNASGLLPWDGLMIAHCVQRAQPNASRPRFLVADWLATQPFVQPLLARLGAVRACPENAERLLRSGHRVVAFPEGAAGATKAFRERYRLKRFGRGGVVRLALATGVPLVPVAVIGAEEAHPMLFRLTGVARGLGLPFVPVTPTFPWLGALGLLPLPARWRIRFGDPLPLPAGGSAEDELLVSRLTEALRQRIQALLDEGLRSRTSVFR